MTMYKNRILFLVNDPAFFVSHRLSIAVASKNAGYEVHVASAYGSAVNEILRQGLFYHCIPIKRSTFNPFGEIYTFSYITKLFFTLKPSLVHLVTIKPVLYGGIAARLINVPALVSAISGLGFLFTTKASWWHAVLRRIALIMYRIALGHSNQRVIFQNKTDQNALMQKACLHANKMVLIRGSGVDLEHYSAKPEPAGTPVVAMASRLLVNKGVPEFVQASRLLSERGIKVIFRLIGEPDPENPDSVAEISLRRWEEQGLIEWLGRRDDIAHQFAEAHVVTLPSYYGEGLPKVLMEAAACARAVVTTDMPGCRDAIESGKSGLLVPPRNATALADAIQRLIENPSLRRAMGNAGRALAEREFSIEKVVAEHLKIYDELLQSAQ